MQHSWYVRRKNTTTPPAPDQGNAETQRPCGSTETHGDRARGTVPGSGPGDSESHTATGSCTGQRRPPNTRDGRPPGSESHILAAEKLNIKLLIYPVPRSQMTSFPLRLPGAEGAGPSIMPGSGGGGRGPTLMLRRRRERKRSGPTLRTPSLRPSLQDSPTVGRGELNSSKYEFGGKRHPQ